MTSVDRILRVMVAIGGGWIALRLTGSLNWLFAALARGLIVYGVALTATPHFLRIKGHTAIQIT